MTGFRLAFCTFEVIEQKIEVICEMGTRHLPLAVVGRFIKLAGIQEIPLYEEATTATQLGNGRVNEVFCCCFADDDVTIALINQKRKMGEN